MQKKISRNFSVTQIDKLFHTVELTKVLGNPNDARAIYWLSQFMLGNVSQPFDAIKKLNTVERYHVFITWIDIIKDVDTLKRVTKAVIDQFVD